MKYCVKCVQPSTRPGIYFNDEGLCGACVWEEEKKHIDWSVRENELREKCEIAKSHKASYDCVIGVSGGKDSTFQALYMRDVMGMRPLLVSSEPYKSRDIGIMNINNIKNLGFDVISISANKDILKKLFKKDFYRIGNPDRASEYCLHASAFIIADKFDIPMIVNGENAGQTLGIENLKKHGGDASKIWLSNTVKEDIASIYAEDVSYEELFMYKADMESIKKKDIQSIWLSNYVKDWGQLHNAKFSIAHGLSILPSSMDPYEKGLYRRYFSLDHSFREVIQLLKYIKFGFGFTTDQACYDIRDGEITRDEGIFLVKELDGNCGDAYVESFCKLIEISVGEFWEVANSFRGPMWLKNKDGYQLDNPIWEQVKIPQNLNVKTIMQRLGI